MSSVLAARSSYEDECIADGILARAELNPERFAHRALEHAGILIGWCLACHRSFGPPRPSEGAPGGLSHGYCPACHVTAAHEFRRQMGRAGR